MGDHRADIKIEFWFHGKTEKADMWINYSPDYDGVDARIKEFFSKCYNQGMGRYYDEEAAYEAKEAAKRAKEHEKVALEELEELARLKAKYEPEPQKETV